jgi:hypothetical protein
MIELRAIHRSALIFIDQYLVAPIDETLLPPIFCAAAIAIAFTLIMDWRYFLISPGAM